MTDAPKLRAYRVTIKSWAGMLAIYAAERRAKAIVVAYRGCEDAGYSIPWQDFVAHREPRFDELAERAKPGECLGWSQERDGTIWGCMRPAEDHVRHLMARAWLRRKVEPDFIESPEGLPCAVVDGRRVVWIESRLQYRVFDQAEPLGDFPSADEALDFIFGEVTS